MANRLYFSDLQSILAALDGIVERKTFVGICGPMGAGKTTLVSEYIQKKGRNTSSSPTYAIQNTYIFEHLKVTHVDLYRLKDEEEIDASGFWDLFQEDDQSIWTEWAEKIEWNLLPIDWKKIRIEINIQDDLKRQYILTYE